MQASGDIWVFGQKLLDDVELVPEIEKGHNGDHGYRQSEICRQLTVDCDEIRQRPGSIVEHGVDERRHPHASGFGIDVREEDEGAD